MSNQIERVYLQPLIVTSDPQSPAAIVLNPHNAGEGYQTRQLGPSSTGFSIIPMKFDNPEDFIVESMFTNVPVIRAIDLTSEYRELGSVLNEMTRLDEGDDWKIEAPVYEAARYVASELMRLSFPPPRIFNHGAQSVVFNWTNGPNNLYLTISANRVSALLSTPERIKNRVEVDYSNLPDVIHVLIASVNESDYNQPAVVFVTDLVSASKKLP
jgi:hypothetical protein